AECNAGDDITIAVVALEPAPAVIELAIGSSKSTDATGGALQGLDPFNGIFDFLPIGADILYAAGAYCAGNAAETFYAMEIFVNAVGHKVIPGFAAPGDYAYGIAIEIGNFTA